MKMIDISAIATDTNNSNRFREFVDKCDYYAVALPCWLPEDRYFALCSNQIKTNIRVVRAEELKFFMKSSKMIIQNGDTVAMNFDGKEG